MLCSNYCCYAAARTCFPTSDQIKATISSTVSIVIVIDKNMGILDTWIHIKPVGLFKFLSEDCENSANCHLLEKKVGLSLGQLLFY